VELHPVDQDRYKRELNTELAYLRSEADDGLWSAPGLRRAAEGMEQRASTTATYLDDDDPEGVHARDYDLELAARDACLQLAAAMEAAQLVHEVSRAFDLPVGTLDAQRAARLES
jgi:hypothetical protein